MLLVSKHLKDQIETQKRESGKKFAKDKIFEIAQKYYTKFKDVEELWILIAAKRDMTTNRINVMIRAADKYNKHTIDVPIQGCQFWYTNQKTGDIYPEWILPLDRVHTKKAKDLSEGNMLIEESIYNASKKIGIDLLTGKEMN